MALWGLIGNDRTMAAKQYAGRESATERARSRAAAATARRVRRHRNTGDTRAARQGQAWEDADRARERDRYRR